MAPVDFAVPAFQNEAKERGGVGMSGNDEGRRVGILDEGDTRNGSAPLTVAVVPAGRQNGDHSIISGLAKVEKTCVKSGRPDSNRRRPAWEAGILPLNYARLSDHDVAVSGSILAVDSCCHRNSTPTGWQRLFGCHKPCHPYVGKSIRRCSMR